MRTSGISGQGAQRCRVAGDGDYRRLLDACRDGKLVSPGGRVLIQFHGKPLAADCWQLEDLRSELENAT